MALENLSALGGADDGIFGEWVFPQSFLHEAGGELFNHRFINLAEI